MRGLDARMMHVFDWTPHDFKPQMMELATV